MTDVASLTTMEVSALTDVGGTLNLTDGHARLPLSAEQSDIVARLPDMFVEATRRPFQEIETEAHGAFLAAVGQYGAPVGTGRILSCYSSTLATDIVARAMAPETTMAVLHPTFDNIADLFRTRGVTLSPLTETSLLAGEWPRPPVTAVVVTQPNNPTGLVIPEDHLASLAAHCAHHGQTLVVDASFRGQDRRAQYDTYAILDAAGPDWIVIEDTGKLWPTHELKVGMLAFSEGITLPLRRAFSESLLSASPVVLLMVAALAGDWACGGYERARELVDRNRAVLVDALAEVGLGVADPRSEISVVRVTLPDGGPDSSDLYRELVSQGIHVLPCPPFHWADPAEGLRFIRLSLARPTDAVEIAAKTLARTYAKLSMTVPA